MKLKPALPHLYFAALLVWIAMDGSSYAPAWIALPFLVQVVLCNRVANVFFGIVTLFASFWLSLAFLSDTFDGISNYTNFFIGLAIVSMNYVMAVRLFKEARVPGGYETANEGQVSNPSPAIS